MFDNSEMLAERICGNYKLESDRLIKEGDKLELQACVRNHAKKGQALRYLRVLSIDDKAIEQQNYVSSLYPVDHKNNFSLDIGKSYFQLTIKSPESVEIAKSEKKAKRTALQFVGGCNE